LAPVTPPVNVVEIAVPVFPMVRVGALELVASVIALAKVRPVRAEKQRRGGTAAGIPQGDPAGAQDTGGGRSGERPRQDVEPVVNVLTPERVKPDVALFW